MVVSNVKKAARLAMCEECEHYVQSTKSCGPLLIGGTVMHEGEERQLCGCRMPVKAQLAFSKCPLDKWGKVHSPVHYLALVKSFSNPPSQADINTYYKIKSELVGRKLYPECDVCAIKEIREFIAYCTDLLTNEL